MAQKERLNIQGKLKRHNFLSERLRLRCEKPAEVFV